ncbi:MAG: TIR domain-containing protein, partial [Gammaproteobacteria bacterium]|nr:TIR domain-containing protein [Gammaproteobacteria bacterium]
MPRIAKPERGVPGRSTGADHGHTSRETPPAALATYRYRAFLSYSQGADRLLATRLQGALEQLARPWYRRRAIRVFRDQTELAAAPELWGSIRANLERSAFFILLACPASVRSRWVKREIGWWLRNRGPQSLIIVLTAGRLRWSTSGLPDDPGPGRDQGDDRDDDQAGLEHDEDAIPGFLRRALGSEPLWVDLSDFRGNAHAGLQDIEFVNRVATLAARLHGEGVSPSDLVGQDLAQHRRTLRLAWSAAATLAVLLLAALLAAGIARHQAVNAQLRADVAVASNLLQTRPGLALTMLVATRARSVESIWTGHRALPELERTMPGAVAHTRERLAFVAHAGEPVWDVALSPRDPALIVSAGGDGSIAAWRLVDGVPTLLFRARLGDPGSEPLAVAVSGRGERIAVAGSDGHVRLYDGGGRQQWARPMPPAAGDGRSSTSRGR